MTSEGGSEVCRFFPLPPEAHGHGRKEKCNVNLVRSPDFIIVREQKLPLTSPLIHLAEANELPQCQRAETLSDPPSHLPIQSENSKLAFAPREHTVQPDQGRQTQILCQRPSHPSNPDPHQGPGPGPRPRPTAHQTVERGDNKQKPERERRGLVLCFSLRLDFSE